MKHEWHSGRFTATTPIKTFKYSHVTSYRTHYNVLLDPHFSFFRLVWSCCDEFEAVISTLSYSNTITMVTKVPRGSSTLNINRCGWWSHSSLLVMAHLYYSRCPPLVRCQREQRGVMGKSFSCITKLNQKSMSGKSIMPSSGLKWMDEDDFKNPNQIMSVQKQRI